MVDQQFNSAERRRNRIRQVAQGYAAAHEIISGALALGLLVGAGAWLDDRLGWSPVMVLVGSALGFLVAGVSFRQLLRRLDREAARDKQRKVVEREQQVS